MPGNRHRGRKTLLVVGFLLGKNMTGDEIQKLEFHIRGGDYFGTLAAVLELVRGDIAERGYQPEHDECLRSSRDTLVYLQENYTIVRKGLS